MSRFSSNQDKNGDIATLAKSFQSEAAKDGNLISEVNAGFVVSTESHEEGQTAFGEVKASIVASMEDAGRDPVAEDDIGLEAATIAVMGVGSGSTYREAANRGLVAEEGVAIYADGEAVPSMEAFDESEIGKHGHYTMAYHMDATRQDDFGETLFPTIVQTPDVAGIDVEIEQTVVHKEVRRAVSGKVTDFGKQKVLDAMWDHTILESNITRIYPVVAKGGDSNAQFFCDPADVAPYKKNTDGVEFETAPLAFGKSFDLLGMSTVSPLNGGQTLTDEDSIDSRVGLEKIYVKVTDKAASKSSVVAFNVAGLPRRMAFQGPERDSARVMQFAFSNKTMLVNAQTKDISDSAAEALSTLADNTLYLNIDINGTIELEEGATKLYGPAPESVNMYDAAGALMSLEDGSTAANIIKNLEFSLVGYDLEAFHANMNLRHRGTLGNTEFSVERYGIGFKAPITAKAPVSEADKRRATDLKTITAISRTRTRNDAVTKLLERRDTLEAYVAAVKGEMATPEIEGAGRHYVNPYFKYLELDMKAVINSTKSHEKAADVADVLVNAIRSIVYPMDQDSNYSTVLDTITNGRETKPRLIIATDNVIQRHLMVSGDERTASIGMEHKIITSPDKRMKDNIFLTFSREGKKGEADPLSFGFHGWIPELVSSAQISQGGSTAKVTTVQPRSRHVGMLPVMAHIAVKNLNEVLQEKV